MESDGCIWELLDVELTPFVVTTRVRVSSEAWLLACFWLKSLLNPVTDMLSLCILVKYHKGGSDPRLKTYPRLSEGLYCGA